MPITTITMYSDSSTDTIKSLLLPNLYWQIAQHIEPGDPTPDGWYQPSFDDSGWGGVVTPGGTLANCFGSYTGPNTVNGIWTRNNLDTNTDIVLYRHYINIPAGNLIGSQFYMWWSSAIKSKSASNNVIYEINGFPGVPYLYFTSLAFINGDQLTNQSSTDAANWIPGQTNLLAVMYNHPIPFTCFDWSGCQTQEFWPAGMIGGWGVKLTYATPLEPPPPPVEGRSIMYFVDFPGTELLTGPNIPRLIPTSGPLNVNHSVQFDPTNFPVNFSAQATYNNINGLWHTWFGPDIPNPEFGNVDYTDEGLPHTGGSGLYTFWFFGDTNSNDVYPTAPSASTIAQGFSAQWTTLQYVRVGMQARAHVNDTLVWPNLTVTCAICPDTGTGIPDTANPLGVSFVNLQADVLSLAGPVNFFFDPPISLIPPTIYWVVVQINGFTDRATGPSIQIFNQYFNCNNLTTPIPPVSPVVYGFATQGSLGLWVPTLQAGQWTQLVRDPNTSWPSGPTCTDPNADNSSTWDISMGGEGLQYALAERVLSSNNNGMGNTGYRDPNTDLIFDLVNNINQATVNWCIDGPIFVDPVEFTAGPTPSLNMGLFTDRNGDGWVVIQRFDYKSWGVVSSNQMKFGEQLWPWPYDPVLAGDVSWTTQQGLAVQNPNGIIIAAWSIQHDYPDRTMGTAGYLNIQTLSGTDPTIDTFGPLTQIFLDGPIPSNFPVHQGEAWVIDMIVDGAGNTHLFYVDLGDRIFPVPIGQLLPPTLQVPVRFFHLLIDSAGNIGQPLYFDNAIWQGIPAPSNNTWPIVGTGAKDPVTGAVHIPYSNGFGCSVMATFDTAGNFIGTEEIPDLKPDPFRSPLWVTRFIPAPFSNLTDSESLSNMWTLAYIGDTPYLFAQDFVGISVAKKIPDPITGIPAWTGYAIYNKDTPGTDTYHTNPNLPFLAQSGLQAKWNDLRQQLALVWCLGAKIVWFQWFDETGLVYPPYTLKGCAQPLNDLPQIIG